MFKHLRQIGFLITILFLASSPILGQQFKSWFFYGPKALAERKVIPAAELTACVLGDDVPPNVALFKNTISAGIDTQPGLLKRKLCDVALIFNLLREEEQLMQQNFPGYPIYKISGSNLELYLLPENITYVAVGSMRLAAEQSLLKKDMKACGTPGLRRLFAPTRNIWKESWADWQAPIKDLKKENNPIEYPATDVWIMSLEDYKIYVKRVGAGYPVFDISPESDELTRRK